MSYVNGRGGTAGARTLRAPRKYAKRECPAATPGNAALYNPITQSTVFISFERNPKTATTACPNVADINFLARVLTGDTHYR